MKRLNSWMSLAPRIVAFCIGFWLPIAQGAEVPINALWNDDDGFGLFFYNRPGSCTTFKYENPPFLVFGNGGDKSQVVDGTFAVKDVKVCLFVGDKDVGLCKAGTVSFKYQAETNEYVGEYKLQLPDGGIWESNFRAEHCKSGKHR
jgi:hypothetical protein